MSVGPFQSQVVYDATSVTNFKSWSKNFISANLSSMGWTQTSDLGQVDWTKILTMANLPNNPTFPIFTGMGFRGAWAAATSLTTVYLGTTSNNSAHGNERVTYTDGITYMCMNDTRVNSSVNNIVRVIAQTSLSLTLSQCSMSGTTMTLTFSGGPGALTLTAAAVTASDGTAGTGYITYTGTITGGGSNAFVGFPISVISFVNAGNNVVACVCTASTATTITVESTAGVNETHAGTANSDFQGWCLHVTGFSNPGNNGYFLVTSSTSTTLVFSISTPGCANYAGVNETHAATAASTTSMTTFFVSNGFTSGGNGSAAASTSATSSLNNYAGLAFTTTNFTASANNTSAATCFASSTSSVCLNFTGVRAGTFNGGSGQTGNMIMVSPPNTSGALYNVVTSSWGWWMPVVYEIWQTNDGLSNIYLKVGYWASQASATDIHPAISIAIGYATDGFGNIVGQQYNFTTSSGCESVLLGDVTAANNISAVYECTMCGSGTSSSGAWLVINMWRTGTSTINATFGFERGLNSSGQAQDAYFTVLTTKGSTFRQQSVLKLGGQTNLYTTWLVINKGASVSQSFQGLTPPFPIFPCLGYVGNPVTIFVCMDPLDCIDGQMVNVTLYGTTHQFMVSKGLGSAVNSNLALNCLFRYEAA